MKIISVVFHPLFIATWLCALLMYLYPGIFPRIQPASRDQFLLILLLITGVLPMLSVFLLKSFSMISTLDISDHKERIKPFIFITFYYAAAAYLFIVKLQMGPLFVTIMVSVSVMIFLLLVITKWIKISIHAAGIWAAAGYFIAITIKLAYLPGPFIYLMLLACGLTCTSRLYLGNHSPKEIWLGSIFGFFYSSLVVFTVA